jgi:hypothetical protein
MPLPKWIRILLFSSLTFKTPTKKLIKKKVFLALFDGTLTSFFKDEKLKEVTKQ